MIRCLLNENLTPATFMDLHSVVILSDESVEE